ncbi:Putative phagocytic receptor 1b [Glycine soja]|nr:Putative phagocytic receptor 1b [Glycine soja]
MNTMIFHSAPQFYLDDLPFWGFIGKLEEDGWIPGGGEPNYYLFTHVQFDVLYNGNWIVQVNAFGDPNRAVDITKDVGVDVKFTYYVIWNATKVRFENRMDRYSRASLMPAHRQVHWFSFINSIVVILLLIGLLALLYIRYLRSDLKKYSNANEEDNEVGWKSLQHGDVFRPPPNSSLLFAVVGTGTQLLSCKLLLLCVLLFLALIGTLYPYNHGGLLNCLVLLYALASVFAGYTAASFHGQFAENGWERSASLAAILYTGPVLVVASILNIVAISYRATIGLPFGSIIVILILLTFYEALSLMYVFFCGCRSVLCGGSTAIFMFGYCIYFYVRSNMSGFLQLSFFIGYNACLCYAFFLIFGAISFRVSLLFVRHIYHDVKRE